MPAEVLNEGSGCGKQWSRVQAQPAATPSERRLDANRENAKKSTGPKTLREKGHSRFNALKHGLFSATHNMSEEDRPNFEAIRVAITNQLAPATVLQQMASEHCVYCCWRVLLAMQLEMKCVKLLLPQDQNPVADTALEQTLPSRPYLASATDRRNARRLLSRVRQVVADSGSLHLEEYKDTLIAVFGNEFYESLTWAPQNVTAIHLANQLTLHAKIFNRPLPEKLTADGGVILDPNQSWRMVLRLIDQKMQHLHDLGRVSEQELGGSAQQPIAVLDVASRYFSAVMRERDRGLAFYLYLKEAGL
jgi:hypothetical protein